VRTINVAQLQEKHPSR